ANNGIVHADVRSKCPLKCAAMYGEPAKIIPASIAAPRSRVARQASAYAHTAFNASPARVVTFNAVSTGKRPSSVAPTKADRAVLLCRVRSAPTGEKR